MNENEFLVSSKEHEISIETIPISTSYNDYDETGDLVREPYVDKDQSLEIANEEVISKEKSVYSIEAESLSLFSSPFKTFRYFLLFVMAQIQQSLVFLAGHLVLLMVFLCLVALLILMCFIEGPHQGLILGLRRRAIWYGYWVLLGIASSIGLGTGLHTFFLFLGPFIARVTLMAYETNSIDFETHGMNAFVYHPDPNNTQKISVWLISTKIRGECFFWGFGSALGELPPYFMARAASLTGKYEEELETLDLLEQQRSPTPLGLLYRPKVVVYRLLKHFGFWGILLCASVPNPLFDLAGITCGHFLISFTTFFGATLIGKAIIKVSVQSLFIVILFSKDHMDKIMSGLERIAPIVHSFASKILLDQKHKYRMPPESRPSINQSIFASIWNCFLLGMILYFALSIVQSLARSHLRLLRDRELEKLQ